MVIFLFFFNFFLDIYKVRKKNEENIDDIEKNEIKQNTSTLLKNDNNKQNINDFGLCCPWNI